MIGMKLRCAKRLSPTASPIPAPMIVDEQKPIAISYKVSHSAAGTPGCGEQIAEATSVPSKAG